jgi:GNAT superfamily N-acetyltransferase
MLRYRTFQNADPPLLADIWRSRAAAAGLIQPISVDLFEQQIFAKPYFDYAGLILALDEGRAVGFAHAAFGPNQACNCISTEEGVTCLVVVRPDCREAEVAAGLLRQSEEYLRARGARVLYGGAARPMAPFYFGLYRGSEPAGVLRSDTVSLHLYRSHGYAEVDRRGLFRCWLSSFRPPIDRQQLQWRRKMQVEERADPPAATWWEACLLGDFDLTRYVVVPRSGGPPAATATFRGMEPPDDATPGRSLGLIDLEVDPAWRRQGLATFVLSEAFRQFARQGAATIETQTSRQSPDCLALLDKMQLKDVGEGIVFRKEV